MDSIFFDVFIKLTHLQKTLPFLPLQNVWEKDRAGRLIREYVFQNCCLLSQMV